MSEHPIMFYTDFGALVPYNGHPWEQQITFWEAENAPRYGPRLTWELLESLRRQALQGSGFAEPPVLNPALPPQVVDPMCLQVQPLLSQAPPIDFSLPQASHFQVPQSLDTLQQFLSPEALAVQHLPGQHLPGQHLPDQHLPDQHLPDQHLPDQSPEQLSPQQLSLVDLPDPPPVQQQVAESPKQLSHQKLPLFELPAPPGQISESPLKSMNRMIQDPQLAQMLDRERQDIMRRRKEYEQLDWTRDEGVSDEVWQQKRRFIYKAWHR